MKMLYESEFSWLARNVANDPRDQMCWDALQSEEPTFPIHARGSHPLDKDEIELVRWRLSNEPPFPWTTKKGLQ
jgi:hypothetical protein